jgi:hypothetical protein
MTEIKTHFSLVKPTVETPFYIDFEWWKQHDNNWRVYIFSCLCAEHQAVFTDNQAETSIDWIDPETAEVQTVDGLQHVLITHCAKQEGFVTEHTTLVDGVFRTLMANGNAPMTPTELSKPLCKTADVILKTLAGPQVYKGIRPRAV